MLITSCYAESTTKTTSESNPIESSSTTSVSDPVGTPKQDEEVGIYMFKLK